MTRCTTRRLLIVALHLVAAVGVAGTASATPYIATFGGQTQYQDASPPQYALCLTVNSDRHLESDYCGGARQNLNYGGNRITWTSGSTTFYATDHGSYVSMDTYTGSLNQQWGIAGSELITWDGKCLGTYGGSPATRTPIQPQTCDGGEYQSFLIATNTTSFTLFNEGSTEYLEEASGSYTMASNDYSDNQRWYFTEDGYIQNVATGHCIQENSDGTLSPVTCGSPGGTFWDNGQEWTNETFNYAYYQSLYSGLCLTDVSGTPKLTTCSDPSAGDWTQSWNIW
jgi:hypothetical protein